MKRTNLVLDEDLLETATRLLGVKTYSEAVNRSLELTIKHAKIRGLLELAGTGAWDGDLTEMRQDKSVRPPARRKAGHR